MLRGSMANTSMMTLKNKAKKKNASLAIVYNSKEFEFQIEPQSL